MTPSCQKLGSRRCLWQLKTPVARLASTAPSAVGFDDYDEGRKNFSLEVPEYFNFVTDVIDKWAEVQEVCLRWAVKPIRINKAEQVVLELLKAMIY